MSQTFVYNSGKSEDKVDELHINFGLFFDGTLNSKENTRIREAVEEKKAKSWEIKIYKKHGGKEGENVSFQNDYTNVARMQKECNEDYAIYVEGIGTVGIPSDIESQDKKQQKQTIKGLGDVTAGYAMGAGVTGIRGKVCKACEQLAELINIRKRKNANNDIFLKNNNLRCVRF